MRDRTALLLPGRRPWWVALASSAGLLLLLASSASSSPATAGVSFFVRPWPAHQAAAAASYAHHRRRRQDGSKLFGERYTAATFGADDPLQSENYWEDLFMKGKGTGNDGAAAGGASAMEAAAAAAAAAVGGGVEPIEVISFDLDDTLWCGKSVISNANKAMQAFLQERYPKMVEEGKPTVWSLMNSLAQKFPDEYLEDAEDPGSVVRFTDLRKLALSVLAQMSGYGDGTAVAEEAFAAWHDARHAVDPHFYPGAVDLLRSLKARGLRLVAVTNGNCDVTRIPALDGVFDFCINAEKVGARKRTGKPYAAAVKQAGFRALEVGGRWVHIGDDFTEDIVAAKHDHKFRTIWYNTEERKAKAEREAEARMQASRLDERAQGEEAATILAADGRPSLSTLAAMATDAKDRFFRDQAAVSVSTMEADDYLAYAIVNDFVDAEVATIEEMGRVIEAWLEAAAEAAAAQEDGGAMMRTTTAASSAASGAAAPSQGGVSVPVTVTTTSGGVEEDGCTKFCIACREVLPKRAKFCSACGEAQ